MRIVAGVEYNGQCYYGWQTQTKPPLDTLQDQCEKALSKVANHPVSVTCAGRTDRGVHALGQVIHFDTLSDRALHAWIAGTNHYLPSDIRLLWAKFIPFEFHARYSALTRCYRYILYNHPIRPALLAGKVSWYPIRLDVEKMQIGAQFLLGENDFSAFRSANCQSKSPIRRVDWIQILQLNQNFIEVKIQANAFLHHMVRNIVGVLLEIGSEKHPPDWAQKVLISRQRNQGGVTALPHGLYLANVAYPTKWDIPTIDHRFFPILIDNYTHSP